MSNSLEPYGLQHTRLPCPSRRDTPQIQDFEIRQDWIQVVGQLLADKSLGALTLDFVI